MFKEVLMNDSSPRRAADFLGRVGRAALSNAGVLTKIV